MKKLLFVDTNIYLDFYRARNETGLGLLKHLDAIKDQLIVTDQIEMEFLKHRQIALLETINYLKAPSKISRPGLLSEHNSLRALQRGIDDCGKHVKKLSDRLARVFREPSSYDPIHKVAMRIFAKKDKLNLRRDSKFKNKIRRQAFRRFMFGYPPRKQGDTSYGDSINWEWIIHCAIEQKADIWIVSRDSDYGVTFGEQSYLNDWLEHEFSDRVSQKRKVVLTKRLSEALKEFAVPVTKAEETEEVALVEFLGLKPGHTKEEFNAAVDAFLKSMDIGDQNIVGELSSSPTIIAQTQPPESK